MLWARPSEFSIWPLRDAHFKVRFSKWNFNWSGDTSILLPVSLGDEGWLVLCMWLFWNGASYKTLRASVPPVWRILEWSGVASHIWVGRWTQKQKIKVRSPPSPCLPVILKKSRCFIDKVILFEWLETTTHAFRKKSTMRTHTKLYFLVLSIKHFPLNLWII